MSEVDLVEQVRRLETRVAALEAAQQPKRGWHVGPPPIGWWWEQGERQWQRCPICGGTGHLPENFYMGGTDSTGLGRVTCRSCNGLGRVR